MIPEFQQEQAVLYALGLLDAAEAAEFEEALSSSPALQGFSDECREASATLILADDLPRQRPPLELKQRLMARLDANERFESRPVSSDAGANPTSGGSSRRVLRLAFQALPWALAALLMVFCGVLSVRERQLQQESRALGGVLAALREAPVVDPLTAVSFCQLESTVAEKPRAQPQVTVAWDPARQEGMIQIIQLTPPGPNKDYQLWTVEDGRKDAVSAGIIHLDARGSARTAFKPEKTADGGRVLAFAISLEQAGGSPKNAGPIVLLGKL